MLYQYEPSDPSKRPSLYYIQPPNALKESNQKHAPPETAITSAPLLADMIPAVRMMTNERKKNNQMSEWEKDVRDPIGKAT